MTHASRSARNEGFALVEALASLVIVGMIGLMIVDGIGTGHRVWERIDTREARGELIDSVQTLLRDRIEQAYSATLYDRNPPDIDFTGDTGRMEFLSNPPQSERPGPLRRYALTLNANGQLELSSVSDAAPPNYPKTGQVLLDRVQAVEFSYFGRPSGGGGERFWQTEWVQQDRLPELVRIRVRFEPGDQRQWPDLLVHPLVTIDRGCSLNIITHHCKGRI
jgi:general secretion pathway protein J